MRLALILSLSVALPLSALCASEVAAQSKTDTAAARAATARANARAAKAKAAAEAAPAPSAETSESSPPAAASDAPTATAGAAGPDASSAPVSTAAATPPAAEPGASVGPSAVGSELAAGAINAGAAPTDDFGFVSWCAGAVEGYMKLKPAVLPDVRRIEARFREPGRTLAQDMLVYDDLEKEGRRQSVLYGRAIRAAEKASPRDISDQGFTAYKRGLAVWAAPAESSKARIAQEWMGWALPEKCETTAKRLIQKSALFGEALKPNQTADSAPTTADDAGLKGPK